MCPRPSASAAANALASNTFADNMQDVTVVRSGSMTIPFGSMSADELAPAAGFTYVINFSTPYLYNPGEDIVIMVRHNGHGDTVVTKWNFDSFGYTGGTKVTTGTGNIDATTAALSFDTVNKYQFTYEVVPEPASLGVLAMGSLLLVRRRR